LYADVLIFQYYYMYIKQSNRAREMLLCHIIARSN